MSRTYRTVAIPFSNLATEEEFYSNPWFTKGSQTYERYLATCKNDRRNGKWYPSSEFRRSIVRKQRAKQNFPVKNWMAHQNTEDIEIPRIRRSVWWEWF